MPCFVQKSTTITGKLSLKFGVINLLFLANLMFIKVLAQDIHFSQYLSSPFNLNPALTGDFKGDYRLIANYRNQWNAITTPFKTYGFAADMTNVASVKNLSAGASVYSDQAGDSRMNTLIMQLSGSYGYPLTADSSHSIYFGLMPAIVRQQFDYSELSFDNQYDNQRGIYDRNIPTGELQNQQAVSYFNMSAGLRWNHTISKRNKINLGIGMFNLLNSNKLYTSDAKTDLRRLNVHANYQFKVWTKIDLLPSVLYLAQGENTATVVGSSARYLFNGYTAFHGGVWYRNEDAMFFTFGLTYQTLFMGFSYDVNTSGLQGASSGRGAYELSLIYVFQKFKPSKGKYLSCPNYL